MEMAAGDMFMSNDDAGYGGGGGGISFEAPAAKADQVMESAKEFDAFDAAEAVAPQAPAADADKPNDQPTTETKESERPREVNDTDAAEAAESADAVDVSQVPKLLDDAFDRLDLDHAVRPAIIHLGDVWRHRKARPLAQRSHTGNGLEVGPEESVDGAAQTTLRQTAFDLLEALTRSGGLPCEDAELHVVVAATHVFDESVLETVVRRDMNPIEAVERSEVIMASVVHGQAGHRNAANAFAQAEALLRGETQELLQALEARMMAHSDKLEFEQAAEVCNQIQALSRVLHQQSIETVDDKDVDILAVRVQGGRACVNLAMVRGGRHLGD
eukprot:gene14159-16484_t